MLAEDAILIADGGGKKYAALNPIYGRDKIMRFLIGLVAKFGAPKAIDRISLNGHEGFLIAERNGDIQTWCLDWSRDGSIKALYQMRNPDKLRHILRTAIGPSSCKNKD
jgi:RNA polymerase sigma-70 factor (ECF subfamily)